MSATETSFTKLASVDVHYDRLPAPFGYGSKGKPRSFECRNKLKTTLNNCMDELFDVWNKPKPTIILSAGTIGDGMNAHGQGYAFDLDGFYWGDESFMMKNYPQSRQFYIGINAHLFLYFSQVLSYHYQNHDDHFHVDFNFSYRYRPESNAQTFFLQSALKYIFGKDLGTTGAEDDGVDGIYDRDGITKQALHEVLKDIGLWGQGGLTVPEAWKAFLKICRTRAFA